ncbi:MAG: rane protein insertion efficiency factor YidD [Verrucomicrobiota bacterium]|jgi:putative membrane protein insertion efficiency factor
MLLIFRWLIWGYQKTVSPVLAWITGPGGGCRFQPTCSNYCLEAVEVHGVFKGGWLGLLRIGRCQPWGGAGWDPVPRPDSASCGSACGVQWTVAHCECVSADAGKSEKDQKS